MMPHTRLLIIPCSEVKDPSPDLLPAWERYQGRVFVTLKEVAAHTLGWNAIDVVIISGKFGFLRPTDPIEWYDQIMTPELAAQHRPGVTAGLAQLLTCHAYRDTFILLEPTYLSTVNGLVFPNAHIEREITDHTIERLIQWVRQSDPA